MLGAIALGDDTDTMACIAGAIAEAYLRQRASSDRSTNPHLPRQLPPPNNLNFLRQTHLLLSFLTLPISSISLSPHLPHDHPSS